MSVSKDRKKARALAESIVALGDEAGYLFLVGPQSLAVCLSPTDVRLLTAAEVLDRGQAAEDDFSNELNRQGVDHPNIRVALALFKRLAVAIRNAGLRGDDAPFTGVGKSSAEIDAFFNSPRTPKPPVPISP